MSNHHAQKQQPQQQPKPVAQPEGDEVVFRIARRGDAYRVEMTLREAGKAPRKFVTRGGIGPQQKARAVAGLEDFHHTISMWLAGRSDFGSFIEVKE